MESLKHFQKFIFSKSRTFLFLSLIGGYGYGGLGYGLGSYGLNSGYGYGLGSGSAYGLMGSTMADSLYSPTSGFGLGDPFLILKIMLTHIS